MITIIPWAKVIIINPKIVLRIIHNSKTPLCLITGFHRCRIFNFLEYLASKEGKTADDFSIQEIEKYVYKARPLRLGAQDCGIDEAGQFTGDISAKLLKEVNCEYVIIGHSERRLYHYESNSIVGMKVARADAAGLNVWFSSASSYFFSYLLFCTY